MRCYPPMKAALERAHIPICAHRARQLRKEDYSLYDLFIGMDEENEYYMRQILGGRSGQQDSLSDGIYGQS